ncbi:MATE family efflux transporter [Dokdonella fugitiva]|uniref:Multidrug-efflux transporter n=1 Tax=Dokdonella fugitiva TaxID=328517 RepID=A0A4R2IAD2_9GAMM|nr:MATE family efflux transporter [Dokdonella fugitiva]TCO41421.1 MATE family multidrug resistance protein [Dokdonella fugitiva]
MPTILHRHQPRLARELKDTLRLAVPLVLGQLSAVGMNLIDALLAGHLDAHTLGSVAVGASVWSLALVAAIGVMMALPPSVAQLAGAGRREAIGPLFRQAVWLALVLGLVLGIAVHEGGAVLVARIGIDAELVPDVIGFLHAVAWGAPALALFFALRGLGEGIGLTRPTMYFSGLGLLLLGPIGYVLMYGRLGLPSLGARGSGMATALVLWLEMIAFATYVVRSRHYRDLRLFERWERPNPHALAELLRIGVPMGVSLFMEASLFVAVALVIGTLGTDVVAGHQVALNVASVTFMVPLGLAMATTVRVGHAVGRGDAQGVRDAGLVGISLTLLAQTVSAGAMLLLPRAIAMLYTDDAVVIALAAQLLVLAGLFQFSDGIQVAANGALRGLKDTRIPMLITTFAYWGVGMPVGWWLAFPHGFGARGMWMGLIAGLSMAALLLSWRFWKLARGPLPGTAGAAAASPTLFH